MQVDRIELPGPDQVGSVNVYLLRGEKNILIDTGPRKEETFEVLEHELQEKDLKIEDLDMVLITHPHSDHFGNASRLRQSGAEIAIHEDASHILEDYAGYLEKQEREFEDYFRRHGIPEGENSDLVELAVPGHEGVSVEVDRDLSEGDIIEGLKVVSTPGHATGSSTFLLEDTAFVGDTVLKNITPNPMLYIGEDRQPGRSLVRYIESLERLKGLEIDSMMPGHGEEIDEPAERIDEILDHHVERKQEVLSMIKEKKTSFEVMDRLFEDLPREKYFFGMSEAIGHLELLVHEGRTEKLENGGKVEYLATH